MRAFLVHYKNATSDELTKRLDEITDGVSCFADGSKEWYVIRERKAIFRISFYSEFNIDFNPDEKSEISNVLGKLPNESIVAEYSSEVDGVK